MLNCNSLRPTIVKCVLLLCLWKYCALCGKSPWLFGASRAAWHAIAVGGRPLGTQGLPCSIRSSQGRDVHLRMLHQGLQRGRSEFLGCWQRQRSDAIFRIGKARGRCQEEAVVRRKGEKVKTASMAGFIPAEGYGTDTQPCPSIDRAEPVEQPERIAALRTLLAVLQQLAAALLAIGNGGQDRDLTLANFRRLR